MTIITAHVHVAILSNNLCLPLSCHALYVYTFGCVEKLALKFIFNNFFKLTLIKHTFDFLSLTWRRQFGSGFSYEMTSSDRIAVFNSAVWKTSPATSPTKASCRAGQIAECAEISRCTVCINQLLKIINGLRYVFTNRHYISINLFILKSLNTLF